MERSRYCCSLLWTCLLSVIFLIFQVLLQLWLELTENTTVPVHHAEKGQYTLNEVNEVVLVWWTPFTGSTGSYIECGPARCFITQDRSFRYHSNFQMFLFYGSNIDIYDLPLPRKGRYSWSLLHEESPKNVPFLSHHEGISLFNYTSTFNRFSDIPLTLQHIKSVQSITDKQFFVPLKKKNELLQHLSPVLYIQSDCDTPLDRDRYVADLMKHVSVDSYGTCLHNKDLPTLFTNAMQSINSEDFLHFVAQYKFTIAFENAVCHDYITEKLWRPLSVGSVPVYMGSPSIKDWLPNPNSAVLVENFSSPVELAAYILDLNTNDEKYLTYLSHKEGIITNQYFLSKLESRGWGPPEDSSYHFIDHFQCEMCLQAHLNAKNNVARRVSQENYFSCPKPISSLNKEEDPTNPWLHLWAYGKCQASVLNKYIQGGYHIINDTIFNSEVQSRFKKGDC